MPLFSRVARPYFGAGAPVPLLPLAHAGAASNKVCG